MRCTQCNQRASEGAASNRESVEFSGEKVAEELQIWGGVMCHEDMILSHPRDSNGYDWNMRHYATFPTLRRFRYVQVTASEPD
jgi:hypothetical protein